VSGSSQYPTPLSREDELVQLLLGDVAAAKAAGAHTTIVIEIHVSNGELRGAELKHSRHWRPAVARRRPTTP